MHISEYEGRKISVQTNRGHLPITVEYAVHNKSAAYVVVVALLNPNRSYDLDDIICLAKKLVDELVEIAKLLKTELHCFHSCLVPELKFEVLAHTRKLGRRTDDLTGHSTDDILQKYYEKMKE